MTNLSELTRDDVRFILSRLPRDVRDLIKDRNLYLAGGFIRATIAGEKPADIDLFGPSKNVCEAAANFLHGKRRDSRLIATANAFTVLTPARVPVQFIHRWTFDDAPSVAASFDFTIAQAVVWYHLTDGWRSSCSARFYSDLAARRLVYTCPIRNEDAGGSLLRVRKFLAKGYTIQAPALAKVIARLIQGVDPERKMVGDEAGLARVLCGLLREVDPLLVIDGVEVVDEHEAAGEDLLPDPDGGAA